MGVLLMKKNKEDIISSMKEKINRIIKTYLDKEVDLSIEWERLVQKIDPEASPHIYMRKNRLIPFLRYGVAALAGMAVLFFAENLIRGTHIAEPTVAMYKMQTEAGDKSNIELPDGTRIWLNNSTTIEYESSFGIKNRTVLLKGEAYFMVAKNKDLPFIVKAQGVDIKALGTSFNVSAYPDDSELTTTLFSGKVSVLSASSNQVALLTPNQTAIYRKEENVLEKRNDNRDRNGQWREGIFSFEMKPLQEITKVLERNHHVIFQFKNQRIRKLRFSGSFRDHESISEIMKVIKANTSVNYSIKGDTIQIN